MGSTKYSEIPLPLLNTLTKLTCHQASCTQPDFEQFFRIICVMDNAYRKNNIKISSKFHVRNIILYKIYVVIFLFGSLAILTVFKSRVVTDFANAEMKEVFCPPPTSKS
jgi:hypothetical protein